MIDEIKNTLLKNEELSKKLKVLPCSHYANGHPLLANLGVDSFPQFRELIVSKIKEFKSIDKRIKERNDPNDDLKYWCEPQIVILEKYLKEFDASIYKYSHGYSLSLFNFESKLRKENYEIYNIFTEKGYYDPRIETEEVEILVAQKNALTLLLTNYVLAVFFDDSNCNSSLADMTKHFQAYCNFPKK